MSTQEANPASFVLQTVMNATDEWMKEHTPEKLRAETLKRLDANAERIVMYLLGFDTRNGKFELDHCNGRSGNSTAGDYLRNKQQQTINEWLAVCPLPELSKATRKQVTEGAHYLFESSFRERYRDRVIQAAKKAADDAFDAFSVEGALDRYNKTLKLLNPQG